MIALQAGEEYDVFAIGFLPGLPLRGLFAPSPQPACRVAKTPASRPGRIGRDSRPSNGDLSRGVAGRMATARPDAALHCGPD